MPVHVYVRVKLIKVMLKKKLPENNKLYEALRIKWNKLSILIINYECTVTCSKHVIAVHGYTRAQYTSQYAHLYAYR